MDPTSLVRTSNVTILSIITGIVYIRFHISPSRSVTANEGAIMPAWYFLEYLVVSETAC